MEHINFISRWCPLGPRGSAPAGVLKFWTLCLFTSSDFGRYGCLRLLLFSFDLRVCGVVPLRFGDWPPSFDDSDSQTPTWEMTTYTAEALDPDAVRVKVKLTVSCC